MKRISINIDGNTPLIVINGLADSYGLENNDIKDINDATLDLPDKWTKETYSLIAQFVNLDCRNIWNKDKLIEAYNHIISNKTESPNRFDYRSSKYPYSYDPVACYVFCKKANIKLNIDTTYQEMTYYIVLLTMSKIDRGIIGSDATNISIVKKITENSSLEFNTISHPLVKNNIGAIVESIRIWNIDISLSSNPLQDYYANYGKDTFIPTTESLIRINDINPYRLKFGTYFNRNIPINLYKKELLCNFYSIEGIDNNIDSLLEYSIYNTFHHLRQPEVIATCTSFTKDNFSEIKGVELLSYGVLSCSYEELENNTMAIYTIDELTSMFHSQKNFIDPLSGEQFSKDSIKKLSNICSGLIRNNVIKYDVKQKAKELKSAIEMVIIRQQDLSQQIINWANLVENNKNVQHVLETLLDSGMYMRAWAGPPHPYPIMKAIEDNRERIYKDTTISLSNFNDLNNALCEEMRVDKLPLVKYFKGHFVESDCDYEGRTIADRISIIDKGETIREMSSCIRLSSNFIIASAYRYLQLIGKTPNFSIGSMIDTS